MTYNNVSVTAQGQTSILAGGTAATASLGLVCGNFPAGHMPIVGTAYTIQGNEVPGGRAITFEGYKCLSTNTPKPGSATFSAH